MDNEQKSFVVAMDLATGEDKWRKEREEASNWGSPIVWTNAKRTELVTAGKTIRSYNPQDGTLDLVRVNKLPEENARYWATSAASDGTLFLRSTNTLYAVAAKQ